MYLSIFCCRKQLSPPRLFLSLCFEALFSPFPPPLARASSFPARKELLCRRARVSLFVQWPSGAWSRFLSCFLLWKGTGSEGAELRERAEPPPPVCRLLPVCTLPSAPLVSAEGRMSSLSHPCPSPRVRRHAQSQQQEQQQQTQPGSPRCDASSPPSPPPPPPPRWSLVPQRQQGPPSMSAKAVHGGQRVALGRGGGGRGHVDQ